MTSSKLFLCTPFPLAAFGNSFTTLKFMQPRPRLIRLLFRDTLSNLPSPHPPWTSYVYFPEAYYTRQAIREGKGRRGRGLLVSGMRGTRNQEERGQDGHCIVNQPHSPFPPLVVVASEKMKPIMVPSFLAPTRPAGAG